MNLSVISQGSAATRFKFGEINYVICIGNFFLFHTVNRLKFDKVRGKNETGSHFLDHSVYSYLFSDAITDSADSVKNSLRFQLRSGLPVCSILGDAMSTTLSYGRTR